MRGEGGGGVGRDRKDASTAPSAAGATAGVWGCAAPPLGVGCVIYSPLFSNCRIGERESRREISSMSGKMSRLEALENGSGGCRYGCI